MSVARDVLHKSPLLLNAAEGTEEVVELDRDPAAVCLILDYCSSGMRIRQAGSIDLALSCCENSLS